MKEKNTGIEENVVSVSELPETVISQVESVIGESDEPSLDETKEGEFEEIWKTLKEGGRVLFQKAIKVLKLAFMPEINRKIIKTHVKELAESLKQDKTMLYPIEVIPAEKILEEKILLQDAMGKTIKSEDEDVQKTVGIGNGQHRAYAIMMLMNENKDIELDAYIKFAEIPEGMKISDYIKKGNVNQLGWNYREVAQVVLENKSDEDTRILFCANDCHHKYKMGFRTCFKIFHLSDVYKKADVTNCLNGKKSPKLKGTKEQFERGKRILDSFLIGFRDHPELLKNSAAIDNFISIYMEALDEKKSECVKNLITFYTGVENSTLLEIESKKSIQDKKQAFASAYNQFLKEWNTSEGKAKWTNAVHDATEKYKTKTEAISKKEPGSISKKKNRKDPFEEIKNALC
ncbi:hypothetical protein [uncultured Odoribacter sp.]|uniref:hypothetical protein n=1 Tax=uncultured Odoribacter sp. TaxID=876416 RepID=UPI0026211803|nr:hypothetical protein [uncultured Odoribacter sp.]